MNLQTVVQHFLKTLQKDVQKAVANLVENHAVNHQAKHVLLLQAMPAVHHLRLEVHAVQAQAVHQPVLHQTSAAFLLMDFS